MHKVLIVDDEEWTRISIKKLIDWQKLGMEVVGEARNGQAALELIRREPPDILITDIRMPVMDGLVLMERVRAEYPGIVAVLLSGYSEFEYAKKAIAYGVFDYVLKPIDEEQLESTLRRAAERLNEEDSRRNELVQMNIRLNESGPLTKEKALTQLVTDAGMGEEQRRATWRRAVGGPLPEDDDTHLAALVFESANFQEIATDKYGADEGLTSFVLMNVLDEALQPLGEGALFRKFGRQNEFVWLKRVTREEGEAEYTGFYRELEQVLEKLKRLTGFKLYVGVGGEFARLSEAVLSYGQASEAVRNAGIVHRGMIVHTDEVSGRDEYYVYPDNKEKALLYYLENGYGREASAMINELIHEWQANDRIRPDSIRDTLDELKVGIRKLLKKYGVAAEEVFGVSGLTDSDGAEYRSLEEMRRWLHRTIDGVTASLSTLRKVGARRAVQDIASYLRQHYAEEISLHALSERFHLNPAYLSRLFKSETGQTFNDFLSEVRMEAAAGLLRLEQLKVGDIGPIVGYDNGNYFMRKFKERFGCTPSEYRRNTIG